MVTRRILPLVLGFGIFAVLGFGASSAQASVINDIPDALNGWLFDGTNLYAAKMLVSGMVMASLGLSMAISRLPILATLVCLFAVMASLTAIGWMDKVVLLLSAVLTAGLFAVKMREIYHGAEG